jgi:hypothetical protein
LLGRFFIIIFFHSMAAARQRLTDFERGGRSTAGDSSPTILEVHTLGGRYMNDRLERERPHLR